MGCCLFLIQRRRTMTDGAIRTLAQAVETYYEELKAFIARRTGSAGTAADVVQETWLRAAVTEPAAPIVNPRAYLYRMASHIAVDHLRRDAGQAASLRDAPGLETLVDPHPNPEEAAIARQELALLAQAVQELPDKCRMVFVLYRGQGLSMRQVAETMGISEKTVEKHIARAMLHCRRRLRRARRAI